MDEFGRKPPKAFTLPPAYEAFTDEEKSHFLTIRGDSMCPELNPGDRVVIDFSDAVPSPAGLFAFSDGVGIVVRRMEIVPASNPPIVHVIPTNPLYMEVDLPLSAIRILGRVVGKITRTG